MKRAIVLAAAALCGLLLLRLLPPAVSRALPKTAAPAAMGTTLPADTNTRLQRPLPSQRVPTATTREDSLRGSEVDGGVSLAADGSVRADRQLRRLFDYFLSRLGERSPAQLRDDLLSWLQTQDGLDAQARAQVMNLFDRYVALQQASAALGRSDDVRADLGRLRDLRAQELGTDLAQAWFGAEQDYAALTLERLAVAHDTTLDAAQRSERLAAIDAKLDPQQRESRNDSTDFQLAVAQSEWMAAQQVASAQRANERAQLWGDAAAERLAELDRQQADWQARLQQYARAREQLFADPNLPATLRDAQLAALLEGFSDAERRRVLTLAQEDLLPR